MTDVLYRYRPLREGNLDQVEAIFTKHELWFSSPEDFNDPFDCAIGYTTEGTEEQMLKYISRCVKEFGPTSMPPAKRLVYAKELTNKVRLRNIDYIAPGLLRQGIGVCCFSKYRDDILMWSHYASSHTGIVLEFKAGLDDHFFRKAQPVIYQENYPSTSILDSHEKRLLNTLLTKSSHWAYEGEYRLIELDGGSRCYKFPNRLLSGVIMGCRMSQEYRNIVQGWVRAHPAKPRLYQAEKSNRSFSLEISPLE